MTFARPGDHPSIGLLLCASHDRVIVEYALRDVHKPIGVPEWQSRLTESLPEDLKGQLPTVEDFEAELSRRAADRSTEKRDSHDAKTLA